MSERDIYNTPEDRVLLRTKDVYQTESQDDITSYSDTLLSIVADFKNSGIPEGCNAQSMVGKSKRGEVACRLFARIDPDTETIEAAGFKTRGCLAMTGCASAACQLIEGKAVEKALEITKEDIREFVDGVPAEKVNALHFAACAIQALMGDFLIRSGALAPKSPETLVCDPDSISCIMAEHCSFRQSLLEMRMAEAEKQNALAESDAVAQCVNLVRENTKHGRLTKPSEWKPLTPDNMTHDELVEKVLSAIASDNNVDDASATMQTSGMKCADRKHGSPSGLFASEKPGRSRFANRGVGVPPIFGNKSAEPAVPANASTDESMEDVDLPNGDPSMPIGSTASDILLIQSREVSAKEPVSVLDGIEHVYDYGRRQGVSDDFELVPPEGYKLVEVNGEWGLVETDEAPPQKHFDVDASGIQLIKGSSNTYLFDSDQMSGPYAHWAFLSAENDPIATFACCVRDESRIYPRPMAASDFANEPLRMDAETVEETWEKVRSMPEYRDIRRTSASNGDVYFYSIDFLDDDHADSLAEWSSVGRFMNV